MEKKDEIHKKINELNTLYDNLLVKYYNLLKK